MIGEMTQNNGSICAICSSGRLTKGRHFRYQYILSRAVPEISANYRSFFSVETGLLQKRETSLLGVIQSIFRYHEPFRLDSRV